MKLLQSLILASLTLSSSFAFAQPKPQEKKVALPQSGTVKFFSPSADEVEFLKKLGITPTSDETLQIAMVDIDSDGNAELFVKRISPSTCDDDIKNQRCKTILLALQRGGWKVVFDRKSMLIDMADIGFAGMRNISVDQGREFWKWTLDGYAFDISGVGKTIEMNAAPQKGVELLKSTFSPTMLKLKDSNVQVGQANLVEGKTTLIAQGSGPGVCGVVLGCPFKVLAIENNAYKPILNGYTSGKIAMMRVIRDGYHDLAVSTPTGFSIYAWDGRSYRVIESQNLQNEKR